MPLFLYSKNFRQTRSKKFLIKSSFVQKSSMKKFIILNEDVPLFVRTLNIFRQKFDKVLNLLISFSCNWFQAFNIILFFILFLKKDKKVFYIYLHLYIYHFLYLSLSLSIFIFIFIFIYLHLYIYLFLVII